jgi:hypothetical protein
VEIEKIVHKADHKKMKLMEDALQKEKLVMKKAIEKERQEILE